MRSKRPSLRLHQGAKRILLHLDRSAPWFCLTWTLKTLDMIILCYDSMIILCLYFLFNYILIYLIILIYIYILEFYVCAKQVFFPPKPRLLWGSGDLGRSACPPTTDIAQATAQQRLGDVLFRAGLIEGFLYGFQITDLVNIWNICSFWRHISGIFTRKVCSLWSIDIYWYWYQ